MTQIDFYTHVEHKHQLACQLTLKALQRNLRVVLYAPDSATAAKLDTALWNTPVTGFIPHCPVEHPLAAETPVILAHQPGEFPHDEVLVNLGNEWPIFFSRFQRLIEIVSMDEADTQAARERFRFYRDRGYDIRTHKLGRNA